MNVEIICEARKRPRGMSKKVRWKRIWRVSIIFEAHAIATIIARPKVNHILLNSKSSDVSPAKVRGTTKKSA